MMKLLYFTLLAFCLGTGNCQTFLSYAQTCASCHTTAGLCTQKTNYVTCSCKSGFIGNGVNCTAISSCGTESCCPEGYTWDNRVGYKLCVDINECTDSTLNKCVTSATCTNKNGIFLCSNTKGLTCSSGVCASDQDCLNIGGTVQCADPCTNYQTLNGSNRLSNISSTGVFPTDRYNFGWFRYTGNNGLRMQEGCVGPLKCGSLEPFTLNGSNPSIGDGIVSVLLNINGLSGCSTGASIPVKACPGGFYVYKFSGTLKFDVYCTDPSFSANSIIPTQAPTTTSTPTTTTPTTTTPTTTTPITTTLPTTTPSTSTPTTTTQTTTPTTTTPTTTTPTTTFTTTTPTTTTPIPATTTPTTTSPTTTPTTTTPTTTTPTTTPPATTTPTTTTPTTTLPTSTTPTTTTPTTTTPTTTTPTTTTPIQTTTTPTTTSPPTTTTTPTTTTPTTTTPTTTTPTTTTPIPTTTTPTTTSPTTTTTTPTTTTPTTNPITSTPSTTVLTTTTATATPNNTHGPTTSPQPEQNITVITMRSSNVVSVTSKTEIVNNMEIASLEINETSTFYIEMKIITPSTLRLKANSSMTSSHTLIILGIDEHVTLTDRPDPLLTGNETTVANIQGFQSQLYSSKPSQTRTITETFTEEGEDFISTTTTTTITNEEIIVIEPSSISTSPPATTKS